MQEIKTDVVGIGNAIVDIIGRCDDAFLAKHQAPKGHMRLVELPAMEAIYKDMGPGIEISGGSAANTMAGIASLGGRAAFIGKVSDDDLGRIFAHDIRAAGVSFETKPSKGQTPTARSLILVTPDGERTMNTYLGVSPELGQGEINADVIASTRIVYLEGYLFDRPEAKAAFIDAASIARRSGRQVALTLSDAFCVDRHRDAFRDLIKSSVDILFANETEIKSLYQTDSFNEAARSVKAETRLAVLTRSENGSLILSGSDAIEVPVKKVAKVIEFYRCRRSLCRRIPFRLCYRIAA